MLQVKISKEKLIAEKPFSAINSDVLFFTRTEVFIYKDFLLKKLDLEDEVVINIPENISELMELLKVKEFFYVDLLSRHKKYKKLLRITKKEIKNFKKAYKDVQ